MPSAEPVSSVNMLTLSALRGEPSSNQAMTIVGERRVDPAGSGPVPVALSNGAHANNSAVLPRSALALTNSSEASLAAIGGPQPGPPQIAVPPSMPQALQVPLAKPSSEPTVQHQIPGALQLPDASRVPSNHARQSPPIVPPQLPVVADDGLALTPPKKVVAKLPPWLQTESVLPRPATTPESLAARSGVVDAETMGLPADWRSLVG